ncbi:MAG: SlyX family protein [Pseudomonadales bacterium]|nr:SlyX family protein [Pseudomonadales bacterium]
MKEQIVELQSQLAFQEELLDQLNAVVARQQQQIDRMQQELSLHASKLLEFSEQLAEGQRRDPVQEQPPHY